MASASSKHPRLSRAGTSCRNLRTCRRRLRYVKFCEWHLVADLGPLVGPQHGGRDRVQHRRRVHSRDQCGGHCHPGAPLLKLATGLASSTSPQSSISATHARTMMRTRPWLIAFRPVKRSLSRQNALKERRFEVCSEVIFLRDGPLVRIRLAIMRGWLSVLTSETDCQVYVLRSS